ncbi:uncharacterized protein Dana_GF21416 [Drosophila ananassae]|uniref:Uncharacterized protein n=1 Tax=Drosophila ananassae TaxID=7217 RepID=B3MS67_DROAN|nr:hapless 2 [Drosophila ananassae]EDV34622.1 uncharacterized protein Dana_GF21416 [Drosophila ananassae]
MKLLLPSLLLMILPILVSGYRYSPSYYYNYNNEIPYQEEESFQESEDSPSEDSSNCEGGDDPILPEPPYLLTTLPPPVPTCRPAGGCGSEMQGDGSREGYGSGTRGGGGGVGGGACGGGPGLGGYGGSDACNDLADKLNPRMKATSIAQNAAQVAKAANEAQMAAAQDASRQVKMQLAEKAMAAARAAEAIMEGKQAMVDNYARELREAEAVVAQVGVSLECSESSAEGAFAAAKEAENEATTFKALLDSWKTTLNDVEGLLEQANADLEEKNQMLTAARARGEHLTQQVAIARQDYEQVKEAAYRAASAAVEARQKASMSTCQQQQFPPPKPCGGLGAGSGGGVPGFQDSEDSMIPRDMPDEAPRPAGGAPCPSRYGGAGGEILSSIYEAPPTGGASCHALLDLYRQRRRQQMRMRRQQLRKKQKRARKLKGRNHREYGDNLINRRSIYDFVDGY